MSREFLRIEGLKHSFGGDPVLDISELGIVGEDGIPAPAICLIGPNGAGKSTLLDIISGSLRANPKAKVQILDERRVQEHSQAGLARNGVQATLQGNRDVIPDLSVFSNLCLVPRLAAESWWRRLVFFRARSRRLKMFRDEVVSTFMRYSCDELLEHIDDPAHVLSYGWRKLLSAFRVSLSGAELLLLDEPFAGLDPGKTELLERLIETWRRNGRAVIFVEHIRSAAMRRVIESAASQVVVLDRGKIAQKGTPDEVFESTVFADVYLGGDVDSGPVARQGGPERFGAINGGESDTDRPTPALDLQDVTARYSSEPVLQIDTFALAPASFVLLVGPNGSGKSTLLGCVHQLVTRADGSVMVFGHDRRGLALHDLVRMGVAAVPQTDRLYADLTVRRNLAIAAGRGRDGNRRMQEILGLFPILRERGAQVAGSLSSGEQAQAALALALALLPQPRLLLADELSIGLDSRGADRLQSLLSSLVEKDGCAVLLAEQSFQAALRRCCLVIGLREGTVERVWEPAEFTKDVQRAFFSGMALD